MASTDMLTKDVRLLARHGRQPDRASRDALVKRFSRLANQLARRYYRGGEPLEDLMQVASIGLLNAIDRFDPERGRSFSSYAVPTIVGELKRHFRDRGSAIRLPRDLQELALRLRRVSEELAQASGRAATVQELAEHLGISAEEVLEARAAALAYRPMSLDEPYDDDAHAPGETLGDDDPGYRRAESAATLEQLMQVLSARDREVLRLRFAEDLTQSEIGERVGISQMHVSRVIRSALDRLRETADEDTGCAAV